MKRKKSLCREHSVRPSVHLLPRISS